MPCFEHWKCCLHTTYSTGLARRGEGRGIYSFAHTYRHISIRIYTHTYLQGVHIHVHSCPQPYPAMTDQRQIVPGPSPTSDHDNSHHEETNPSSLASSSSASWKRRVSTACLACKKSKRKVSTSHLLFTLVYTTLLDVKTPDRVFIHSMHSSS